MDFPDNSYSPAKGRYETMSYRRCGNSGVMLPAISLGLWHTFGESTPFATSQAIARRAFDLGITHIDIANNYGPPAGGAEETFGRLLRTDFAAHRDELFISTKAGYTMWEGPYGDFGSRKYLMASLDQSLRRLGLDYVDLFYHHCPDPNTPIRETCGALADIVRQGKALYAGISNYSAEQAAEAIAAMESLGVPLLIDQERYSMISRGSEEALQPLLQDKGVGMIAFSPLGQGLLTSKYQTGIPATSRAASESPFLSTQRVTDAAVERARKLGDIAQQRGQTTAQMALAWVLRNATSALVGVSSVAQLEENVAALANLEFSPAELTAIEAAL